jgi:hypothetical protein
VDGSKTWFMGLFNKRIIARFKAVKKHPKIKINKAYFCSTSALKCTA